MEHTRDGNSGLFDLESTAKEIVVGKGLRDAFGHMDGAAGLGEGGRGGEGLVEEECAGVDLDGCGDGERRVETGVGGDEQLAGAEQRGAGIEIEMVGEYGELRARGEFERAGVGAEGDRDGTGEQIDRGLVFEADGDLTGAVHRLLERAVIAEPAAADIAGDVSGAPGEVVATVIFHAGDGLVIGIAAQVEVMRAAVDQGAAIFQRRVADVLGLAALQGQGSGRRQEDATNATSGVAVEFTGRPVDDTGQRQRDVFDGDPSGVEVQDRVGSELTVAFEQQRAGGERHSLSSARSPHGQAGQCRALGERHRVGAGQRDGHRVTDGRNLGGGPVGGDVPGTAGRVVPGHHGRAGGARHQQEEHETEPGNRATEMRNHGCATQGARVCSEGFRISQIELLVSRAKPFHSPPTMAHPGPILRVSGAFQLKLPVP